MVNKKGIELSINFLVMILIAVVIFFFGIRFIYSLASEATQIGELTLDELDARIEGLSCQSNEKVCLGAGRKKVKKGSLATFGLNIINIANDQQFEIKVSRSGAVTNTGSPITNSLEFLPNAPRSVDFKRNEEIGLGIGIEVPKNTVSGTYIFDVTICYSDGNPATKDLLECGSRDLYGLKKIYVDVI